MGKFSALEKSELTKDWSLEERTALAHFLEELKIAEKDTVFTGKSENRLLYIIERGSVRLAYESINIDLSDGETFSELSIIHPSAKLAGAIALTDSIFWVLKYEKWEDMKRAAPIVSLKLLEGICKKFVRLISRDFLPPQISKSSASGSGARPPGSI